MSGNIKSTQLTTVNNNSFSFFNCLQDIANKIKGLVKSFFRPLKLTPNRSYSLDKFNADNANSAYLEKAKELVSVIDFSDLELEVKKAAAEVEEARKELFASEDRISEGNIIEKPAKQLGKAEEKEVIEPGIVEYEEEERESLGKGNFKEFEKPDNILKSNLDFKDPKQYPSLPITKTKLKERFKNLMTSLIEKMKPKIEAEKKAEVKAYFGKEVLPELQKEVALKFKKKAQAEYKEKLNEELIEKRKEYKNKIGFVGLSDLDDDKNYPSLSKNNKKTEKEEIKYKKTFAEACKNSWANITSGNFFKKWKPESDTEHQIDFFKKL